METEQMITKKNTVVSLILGIVSFLGIFIPLIGIILGIVAIVLGKKGFKRNTMSKVGVILGIIGLVISIIIWVMATMTIWRHMGMIK